MGLRELGDILKKIYNAKPTTVYVAILIGGIAVGISNYYAKVYFPAKNRELRRNLAKSQDSLNLQKKTIQKYKENQELYQYLLKQKDNLILDYQKGDLQSKIRELYYQDIINSMLEEKNKNEQKQHKQTFPSQNNFSDFLNNL